MPGGFSEAFYSEQPSIIRYCPSLLSDADAIISELALDDFCKQRNFSFNAGLSVRNKALVQFYGSHYNRKDYLSLPSVEACFFSKSHTNRFIVCKMSTEIGEGLFLDPKAEVIPKGSVVMLYAGALSSKPRTHALMSHYVMNFDMVSSMNACDILDKKNSNCFVDAFTTGNLARFIQHAPLERDLEGMHDPDNIRSKVATANLFARVTHHLGFPIVVLQAGRDIQAGEQLLISYGENYWRHYPGNRVVSPYLFSTEGRIIATANLLRDIKKIEEVEIDNLTDAPRVATPLYDLFKIYPLSLAENTIDLRIRLYKAINLAVSNIIELLQKEQQDVKDYLTGFSNDMTNEYQSSKNKVPLDPDHDDLILTSMISDFLSDEKHIEYLAPLYSNLRRTLMALTSSNQNSIECLYP